MQKGTVLNLKHLNTSILFFKKNWCMLTLTLFFILGLLFGSFLFSENKDFLEFTQAISKSYLKVRFEQEFLSVLKSSILINLIFLLLIFILGSSVTGVTFVPLIFSINGIYFGSIAAYIFSQYALKGIAFNAIVLIPPTVITVIFLLLGGRQSMYFSLSLTKITLPQTAPKNLSYAFKSYCIYYIFLIIPIIISALLDAWLSKRLLPYFNF